MLATGDEYRSKLFVELHADDDAHAETYLSLCTQTAEQDVLAMTSAAEKSPLPPGKRLQFPCAQ
jgi:succinyl-CoA synthetase beta subunit